MARKPRQQSNQEPTARDMERWLAREMKGAEKEYKKQRELRITQHDLRELELAQRLMSISMLFASRKLMKIEQRIMAGASVEKGALRIDPKCLAMGRECLGSLYVEHDPEWCSRRFSGDEDDE